MLNKASFSQHQGNFAAQNFDENTSARLVNIKRNAEILIKEISKQFTLIPGEDGAAAEKVFSATESDLGTMVAKAEKLLQEMCTDLADLEYENIEKDPFTFIEAFDEAFEDQPRMVSAMRINDHIVIRTPYLKKRKSMHLWSGSSFKQQVYYALADIDFSDYNHTSFDLYILNFYPEETPLRSILDADNIETKTTSDILFSYMGLDDNSIKVHFHLGSYFSNDIIPGSYTILAPKLENNGLKNDFKTLISILNHHRQKQSF